MSLVRLLLVRHGQTPYNRDLKWHDQSDTGLTDLGLKQAKAVVEALKDEKPIALYSSPLKRALLSAELIASNHKIKVIPKAGLAEIDAGELGGLTYEEIVKKFPDFFGTWESDVVNTAPPKGETMANLQSRCWRAVEEIVASHREGTVIVVSHSFSIAAIICKAIGLPLSSFQNINVQLASISELLLHDLTLEEARQNPTWRKSAILSRLNDTHHLNGLNHK